MLRKSLLFITLMAFLAPSVSIGQTAVNVDANHPFNDGFEGDTCTWTFLNGGSVNAWYWGEATNNGGSHSVYISNNGGVNNSYNTSGAATWVYFTKDFSFESGAYRFSYNWKCAGEGGYDYIRVGLLPSTTAPTPGNGLPSDWISLDNNANLNGSSNWTSRSVDLDITEAGDYKLAFAWRNDGSGGSNPPGAIDNVRITKMVVEPYTYFTQTSDNDFVKGSGLNVVVAEGSVHLEQQMTSVADWNATANLPQSLKGHQMVTWRNYVYLVGGHNGSGNVSKVYRATQQDDGISGWTELNALPVSLSDMAVVATQTHLIVMGGHNASGIVDKIHVAKFNDDGSIGTWQESEQMLPEPRWGLRAAIALDDIYIIGGATDDTLNIATNTVYRASLNTLGLIDTIVAVGSLPAARNGHALAVYDSKLIVTGGYDASQTAQATVYSAEVNLDGTLGSWQSKQALTEATYNHSMLCANGVLAILGGHDGNIPSNKFYYTTLDDTDFSWTLSDVMLSERYAQGAAFAFGNKFFFAGGAATSGVVNSLVSYMAVTTSDEPVMKSAFIGIPYYIGTPKTLQDLSYTLTNPSAQAYEILYRTADEGMNYGNWTSAGSNLPAVVNQSKSYIQYMFRISATGTNDFAIDDVTLTVAGYTQLEGNLNWIGDLTAANSPYLVTSDISFTSGTHNIEPGVTIMFMPNTGLNIGQASVNFNGTQANTILLTAYESGNGSWNGVYFQDASDNGVSSLMEYTTIEKAGSGDNDANLYLYYTNQPTINHCTFQMAVGQGAKFQNSSPTISNSNFTQNTGRGLYLLSSSPTCTACTLSDNYGGVWLDNSAPTFNNTAITGNTYDGIRYQTANFDATFYGVTSSGNKYGMYSCTPNRSFTFDSNEVAFADNTADIAVAGGQISSDQTWNNYANGYALLGNVEIYGGTPKLTLRPGVTLKVQTGYSLYVGRNSNQGGMLYAVGTTSAPITFTSLNDEVGGWTGLRFRDGSDYSSTSSLRHCVVEKATANLVCESTNQPSVMWCTFQDAQNEDVYLNNASISIEGSTIKNATKGLWVNSSAPTLVSVVFENMSECCVYHNNECTVTYSDCTMKDSNFGIRYWTCNKDMVNDDNISFQNNFCNIAVPGGHINETRTWDGNTYAILNDLRVGRYRYDTPNHNRLTIMPGAILKFAEGKRMDVGGYWSGTYWGELYAEGIAEQPITFTSLNGEVGGWNGLVFNGESDDFAGASSSLKHCVIEKGNERNLHLGSTNQPGLIEDCIFRQSVSQCVYMENSRDTIRNCHFEDNQSHSLYYNNGHYVGVLENLTFSGNLYDGVTVNGGHVSEDRVWNAQAYFILNDLRVGRYRYDTPNHNRLTIMPGAILKFAEGKRMDVGGYWSGTYWGELYAEGIAEQPITFTSLNGEVGGWNGLVFNGESDDFAGASSSLKHCVIEKGNERNLHLGSTNQPGLIEDCIFRQSVSQCVYMENSRDTIRNCHFEDNQSHSLYYNNGHYVGVLENLTFSGNLYDGVTVNGGHVSEDRVWNAQAYFILNDLRVGRYRYDTPNHNRLTIMPGAILKFAEGKRMDVGGYWSGTYWGELYAEGTAEQPVTFTSMNGEVGGWNGLVFNGESDDFAGAYSLLKHTVFEKGNEYNLYIQGTTLPEIENSIFQKSNGYGVRIGNEYNRTIKNSVFKNNASHGIYIVQTTPFTLGGSPENANSIYNNGGYAVYQDGGSDIDMTYNFWGEIGSKAIDDNLIYDKKDNSSKGRITFEPVSWFPVENLDHLQGTFAYNDTKPMGNREMNIVSENDSIMATATTDGNGSFDFSNYAVSVYNILDDDFGVDVLAGVNATDALLAMRHFVHLDTLTDARLAVADVNQSGSVNGTDAMLIMRRAVDGTFPAGDFYYYTPAGISFSGDTCLYDLSFLCFGDVNGSYTPQSREQTMTLVQEGSMVAESYQELEIPIILKTAVEMGALTLRIDYPAEYLEIENVVLTSSGESLLFTAIDGELRTAWYDLNPLNLNENDGLVTIKVRANDLSLLDEPVFFTLSPYSELADGSAQVIEDVVIAMPEIVTETLGFGNLATNDGVSLSVYPNPANDVCRLSYELSEAGRVTVSVYNMMGVKVMDVANIRQEEGRHELQMATSRMAAGMYRCRVTFEGESSWVKSTVIIIEK